jgi:hypothetical protein
MSIINHPDLPGGPIGQPFHSVGGLEPRAALRCTRVGEQREGSVVESLRILVVVALLATACGANPAATGQQGPDQTTPTTAMATEAVGSQVACALTIPPQPGFVPPKPYPPQPPDVYQSVWYGTAALWTMLGPEGEVWQDLPEDRGRFTQKTFWWSDSFFTRKGLTPITVTGRRLDRQGSFEAGVPGGGGFREDIGSFMLVGIEIPAGCWELTARYGDTELSYVVLVED